MVPAGQKRVGDLRALSSDARDAITFESNKIDSPIESSDTILARLLSRTARALFGEQILNSFDNAHCATLFPFR